MRQSEAWYAAHLREQALYRACHASPLTANWQELFAAIREADALWVTRKGETTQGMTPCENTRK